MSSKAKLDNCPFCGDGAWFSGYVVQCNSCEAKLVTEDRFAAIERWNTRSAPSGLREPTLPNQTAIAREPILEKLRSLSTDAACIKGTPMVPLHKSTVAAAADEIERLYTALQLYAGLAGRLYATLEFAVSDLEAALAVIPDHQEIVRRRLTLRISATKEFLDQNRILPAAASQMLDRLEQATVEYERATGARVADARREKAEARQALLDALVGKQGAPA